MPAFEAGAGAAGMQDPPTHTQTRQGSNKEPVSPSQGCSLPGQSRGCTTHSD